MTERDALTLKRGQRVRLSADGQGFRGHATSALGTVVSVNATGTYITVHRDGIRQPDRYHCCFWDKLR